MKPMRYTDPWDRRKDETDPWNAPSRKRREKELMRRTGMEDDCAFSISGHHDAPRRTSSAARRTARTGSRPISMRSSSKNPGFVVCLIVLIFLGLLLVITLFTSFTQVAEMAQYGYLMEGVHFWLNAFAPRFIALLLLVLLFFYLTKKQARS